MHDKGKLISLICQYFSLFVYELIFFGFPSVSMCFQQVLMLLQSIIFFWFSCFFILFVPRTNRCFLIFFPFFLIFKLMAQPTSVYFTTIMEKFIETFRAMFTANGKRKFVPRDQVFPFLVFNYSLLLLKKQQFHNFLHS